MPAASLTTTLSDPEVITENHTGPVGMGTLMSYGIGQVGAQLFRDVPATLLPLFFTTMLGVPAWLAGIAILIPKFWVIICDPLVGAISDRKKMTWGRLPFLLVGAILTSISFFFLFVPPHFSSPLAYAVYVGGIFTLGSTAFSIYSVPYLAVASELTDDYHERTRILMYRILFTAVALIIGVGVSQPLVVWYGGGRTGWMLMAATLASICFVTMMLCYLGMRSVKLIPGPIEHVPLLTQFRQAARNRPFRILVGVHFIQQLGQASGYSALALMFLFVIKDINLILPFVMVMAFTTLLIQPLWLYISRRLGKKPTYFLCVIAWVLMTLSWFYAGPGTDVLVTLPFYGPLSTQYALVLFRAVLVGIFNSGFQLMNLSLLTDTIEFDRRKSRRSREGIFSGVFSAIEKLAFAVGPAVGGGVLSLTGFRSSTGGAVEQNSDAILGIICVYALLPAAFLTASLFLLARFKLSEAELDAATYQGAD